MSRLPDPSVLMPRRLVLLFAVLAFAGCASGGPASSPITDGFALVRAMHAQYEGRWYRSLTFTQDTYWRTGPNEERTEVWREWMALPGHLRIEMEDPTTGIDAIYARDSTFIIQEGILADAQPQRNRLLLLGFDVYAQAPAETIRQLRAEGIDLGVFRMDTWQGRPAYVVGTPEQGEVWIDAERLLFVRLVEPTTLGDDLRDVRFESYTPLGTAWIAPRVEVWSNNELVFWEVYRDIEINQPLDPVLFNPRRWTDGVAGTRR